jgi:site-specific DNA-methyltransferase (adenine-specific)
MNRLEGYVNQIICGDANEVLKDVPCNSIDLVITSPPYYKQRDYGGEGIGNEARVEEYIKNLMEIFKECVRVVKNTGAVVFNIGDKYEDGNLLLVPYRFAVEATAQTSVKLINEVTWVKLNPVPKQDKRKLIPSTEPFFIFVKSNDYFFNKDAFLGHVDYVRKKPSGNGSNIGKAYFQLIDRSDLSEEQKNLCREQLENTIREVKTGKIESFRIKIKGIHAEPYGGQNGGRKIHLERDGFTVIKIHGNSIKRDVIESPVETIKGNIHPAVYPEYVVQEFLKLLTRKGDVVLDPFLGSGTTAIVAKKMERQYIGVEINPAYREYASERIANTTNEPLLELFV